MLPLVAMVALVAVVMSEPAPSWAEVAVSRQRRGGCSTCYNNCCGGSCCDVTHGRPSCCGGNCCAGICCGGSCCVDAAGSNTAVCCSGKCCRGTCVQNECQVEEANATADKMEEEGSRHA